MRTDENVGRRSPKDREVQICENRAQLAPFVALFGPLSLRISTFRKLNKGK